MHGFRELMSRAASAAGSMEEGDYLALCCGHDNDFRKIECNEA
jgi:hypothetical protein